MMNATGQFESRWATVNGLRMHSKASIDRVPAGVPAAILVHGAGLSHRYLMPIAEQLAPHVRVYVPDLPGYGFSDDPGYVPDLPELADVLSDWMTATGIDRAAFLGNSMGCQIIAHVAVRHADQIERAILQGPTTDPTARTWRQQLWRWVKKMGGEKRSQTPVNMREYRDAGVHRILRSVQMSFFEDRIEEQLPKMRVPTLVVRGSRDTIVNQRWAEEVIRLLPMGRLVVVPGAFHTMNFQQPLELARVSLPFLLEGRGDQSDRARSTTAGE